MMESVMNMQKLEGYIRAAIDRYQMIEAGDRIAVGVSGGKDSLTLLCALSELRAYYPAPFSLLAISIDPGFSGQQADYSAIEALCESRSVPFVLRRTQLSKVIFEEREEKNPCSLCARMRRGMLHNLCREHGCNKLALGHHADDAAETFLMNLFYGGSVGCFSPKTYLSRKEITVIRPMIFCGEKYVARVSKKLSLPVLESACPVNGKTARAETHELLESLSRRYPDLKAKILGALQRGDIAGWGTEK